MELNTKINSLKFYVNGKDLGFVPCKIKFDKNQQYRLAISMFNCQVEIIHFTQRFIK